MSDTSAARRRRIRQQVAALDPRGVTSRVPDAIRATIVDSDKSVTAIARELDLTETALRRWVQQAEVDAGRGPAGALTTREREELVQLRRETKRLRMERDISKKATAFLAKESE
jgi:transposase